MKVIVQVRPNKHIRLILAKHGPGVARIREILRNAVFTTLSLKAEGASLVSRNQDRPSARSSFGGSASTFIASPLKGSPGLAGDLVGTITTTLVDDHEISELNREYFGKTGPTDVISFPYFGPPLRRREEAGEYCRRESDAPAPAMEGPRVEEEPFGDIVISVQTALSQAEEYGVSLERELALLTVHGTLHLLGYDDMTPNDQALMRKAEEEVLSRLGYS